jgi:hypothetical protein
MIKPVDVNNKIQTALDADDSGRYPWERVRDAVNYGIDFLMLLFDQALAEDKISEESLRDVTVTATLTSDAYSRVDISSLDLWSILAVFPKSTDLATPSVPGSAVSSLIDTKSAKRLTIEEWGQRKRNCFMAGNNIMCVEELKDYGYLSPVDDYVYVSPDLVSGDNVGIVYLKNPTKMENSDVALESDIEFPVSVEDILVQKALTFIGMREAGEQLTYSLSSAELQQLVTVMT